MNTNDIIMTLLGAPAVANLHIRPWDGGFAWAVIDSRYDMYPGAPLPPPLAVGWEPTQQEAQQSGVRAQKGWQAAMSG